MQSTRPLNQAPVNTIRSALMIILVLGLSGTGTELLLLGHIETSLQLIPVVLIAASLMVLVWYAIRRQASSLRVFQGLMLLFVVGGVTGLLLHYRGNVEFELEMYPSLGGLELFGRALTGATPALAPGTMINLGLLGLVYTYRHPLLISTDSKTRSAGE